MTANTSGGFRLIVVGSGSAGLYVALRAARLGPVALVTKGQLSESNSSWAQGGMAAALGDDDAVSLHVQDTIAAGAGLVDELAAEVLCGDAPDRIRDLFEYGVAFDLAGEAFALGREAAHSARRIVHAGGDRTGMGITSALIGRVLDTPAITVLDGTSVIRLATRDERVCGIEVVNGHGPSTLESEAVVLATGGAGQVFASTTNPPVATGDGLALAFEVGAELVDLEFYQFHPTALRMEGYPPILITEAVRGDGAVVRNVRGEAFMRRYHPLADLAPRDVVARSILAEMRETGSNHVLLDCSALAERIPVRFPGLAALCELTGIDPATGGIPIAPAAHYYMGGIRTDTWGRTTVPGLYACGEVACTGVHGANRLASNSLVETVVFGHRAVEHFENGDGSSIAPSSDAIAANVLPRASGGRETLQELMWERCGIERNATGLQAALEAFSSWSPSPPAYDRESLEDASLSIVAQLMCRAALERRESRGAHYRSDFPERDDEHWRRRLVYRRDH